MRQTQGATDDRPSVRRKPGKQKDERIRKGNREEAGRRHATQSMHERRELLRIEELEGEINEDDHER